MPLPRCRQWIMAMLALAMAHTQAGLHAQPAANFGPLCNEREAADVVIGGCTARIESGELAPGDLAAVLALRGTAYLRNRAYAPAFADFERAVALDPSRPAYHRGLGIARGNLRRDTDPLANAAMIEQALADFNEALRLDPRDALSLLRRGEAYVALDRVERGLDDLDQAIRLDPDFAEAYDARGFARHVRGQDRQAIADYSAAIRLRPDFARAFLNRGIAHDALAEYDAAIADFDAATRLDPADAIAVNARGVSLAKQGNTDRAIAEFDRALLLNPRFADAFFNRGQAYYLKGDKDRAVADFIQARQLDKRFPEVSEDMFESFDIDVPDSFGRRRPFSQ